MGEGKPPDCDRPGKLINFQQNAKNEIKTVWKLTIFLYNFIYYTKAIPFLNRTSEI